MCGNILTAAWLIVPSSFHCRSPSHADESVSSLLVGNKNRGKQYRSQSSRILRWYHVHDDDTHAAKKSMDLGVVGEALLPPSKKQRQNNYDVIDGEEKKLNDDTLFDENDDATKLDLRILLIDNHDSYTYNLYQYVSTMTTHPVHVIMNDAYSSYDDFIISLGSRKISPDTINNIDISTITTDTDDKTLLEQYFDCIILSPGPGQPSHPADMGIMLEVIRQNIKLPILGVCLGHQALGYVHGKEVKLSPCGPVHGLISSVMFNESITKSSHDDDNFWNDGTIRRENISICQLFRGLPQEFNVVRYHSLVVDFSSNNNNTENDDSSEIESIAWCDGINESNPESIHNICMALRHRRYPHYGVQFHPESIGTGTAGYTILRNFCEFAQQWKATYRNIEDFERNSIISEVDLHAHEVKIVNDVPTASSNDSATQSKYRVFIHKVAPDATTVSLPSPKQVFEELYSSRTTSFWLDSSTCEAHYDNILRENIDDEDAGCPIASNSRFSIMGSDDGLLSRKIHYFGREHDIQRRGLRIISALGVEDDVPLNEDILSYLRRRLVVEHEFIDRVDVVTFDGKRCDAGDIDYKLSSMKEFGNGADDQIPFDYRGGYVGYLGYEVRHDTQCWILEQEGAGCPVSGFDASSGVNTNPNIPTAAFLFADRSLLFDHQTNDWYIIGIAENDCNGNRGSTGRAEADVIPWIQDMKSKIESIGANCKLSKPTSRFGSALDVEFVPNRSKSQYLSDISRAHEEIRNGESYELCVTNQLEAKIHLPKQPAKAHHETPYELYRLLRENNPAPFSAFMNFCNKGSPENAPSVSICCSSPERFLSIRKSQQSSFRPNTLHAPKKRFLVESKPIKGTAARYTGSGSVGESEEQVTQTDSEIAFKLSKSVKDRAENLMIVDLLRNDLGRVCMVGSVHVPKLMHIESYATVHQMVSTVRGTIDGDTAHAIDVIEACFPGGSMTGAPKQRTMEILDKIEQGVNRGPYSGSLGYISLNGSMDMNIIIRTAVLTPGDNNIEGVDTWNASVGCGGAITALSNSDNEYNEMLIKSEVVRRSILEWVAKVTAETSSEPKTF